MFVFYSMLSVFTAASDHTGIYINSNISSSEMTSVFREEKEDKDVKEIPGRTVLIISLVATVGSLLVIMMLCVLYCYKKKQHFACFHKTSDRGALPPLPIPTSPVDDDGNSGYDEIGEINTMPRMPGPPFYPPTREDNGSDTSDDTIVSNRNSYIHPYQPIVEDETPNKYHELQNCDTTRKAIISITSTCSDSNENLTSQQSVLGFDLMETTSETTKSGQALPCKMVVEYLEVVHVAHDTTTK